jgi:hypothetical protein
MSWRSRSYYSGCFDSNQVIDTEPFICNGIFAIFCNISLDQSPLEDIPYEMLVLGLHRALRRDLPDLLEMTGSCGDSPDTTKVSTSYAQSNSKRTHLHTAFCIASGIKIYLWCSSANISRIAAANFKRRYT